MKRKLGRVLLALILVISLTISVSCTTKSDSNEFIPEFSQERMMETIRFMSAEDGGRIAGFDGEAGTADYISNQFESIGLDVSDQVFPIIAFACENVMFSYSTSTGTSNLNAKPLTFSAATPLSGINGEIIFVGMGAGNDYSDINIVGKIALIMRGGEYFRVKTERAYENGAVAAIFYDPDGDGPISATLTQLSSIPAISIARKDAEHMIELLLDSSIEEAKLTVDSITNDSTSKNVIGLYKSPDNPDDNSVILGAHYDGVDTPSANDNASGIAVVLEMARALSEQKIILPYDVIFIAFGAEEIGLIGSTIYVENMSSGEIDSVLAMINFDMVGVGDSFELNTAEEGEATSLIDISTEVLKQMGYTPTISKTDRSDHSPFSYAGIEAVYIAVGPYKEYHTDFDTYEAIQPEMLVKICEFGTKMLIDELPKRLK